MSTVHALQENPAISRTDSFSVGVSVGTDTSVTIQAASEITFTSPDSVFAELRVANDKVQMSVASALSNVKEGANRKPMGEIKSSPPFANIAVNFADLMRREANSFAREEFNKLFPNVVIKDRIFIFDVTSRDHFPTEFRKQDW